MSRFYIRLLGSFEVEIEGQAVAAFRSDKVRALLAYLSVERMHPHRREKLAGLLWPDSTEDQARGNLRKELSHLRQCFGDRAADTPLFEITRQTLGFNLVDDCTLDIAQFTDRLAAYRTQGKLTLLEEAVQHYRGSFLDGFSLADCTEFEAWLRLTREQLHHQLCEALQQIITHYERQGHFQLALPYARLWVEQEPWQEASHQTLIRLLALSGERSLALIQYETCSHYLEAELGVKPAPETQTLAEQIRLGQLSPVLPKVAIQARGGWQTIPAFDNFYGREADMRQLENWMLAAHCRAIAILGMGGLGKTALAAKRVHTISERGETAFDSIWWHGLLNAPPLSELLPDLLRSLCMPDLIPIPTSLDQQLELLLAQLQQKRCLLILDNAESILKAGTRAGTYLAGYVAYEQLLNYIGQHTHQSCLLLTSRERPHGWARLERDNALVHSLTLSGLSTEACRILLHQQGLTIEATPETTLIARYDGHPLALKLVSETILDLYFGDVEAFLTEETLIFADIRDVLDQQFARLSPLEQA